MTDLAALSDEELAQMNQGLMAERAEVESRVKAQQMAIQQELDLRDAARRVGDLSPDQLRALLSRVESEG